MIETDCIVLAGTRDEPMPTDQAARLDAATDGGYIVGGTAAVPNEKVAGRGIRRIGGADRWATATLVGQVATGDHGEGPSAAGQRDGPSETF
ncbi:hypothetical protein [Candidatus Poriferisodalis sp.]|uniref:hypothetical protein n=1 Tax=Candidatus Poriferisodalis sp. TaxID=3101277 RepID=UPI003B51AAC3